MHWQTKVLAANVPERDVDCACGVHDRTLASVLAMISVDLLPECFRAERIQIDQQRS
jgi:hypothetical protein